jgi:hypothetical protein
MLGLAVLNRCPLIVKNGLKAKWYLKGRENKR